MNPLIKRLEKGITIHLLRLAKYEPVKAMNKVLEINDDMARAAELLKEAHAVICGLTGDNTTFGDKERAALWIKKNH